MPTLQASLLSITVLLALCSANAQAGSLSTGSAETTRATAQHLAAQYGAEAQPVLENISDAKNNSSNPAASGTPSNDTVIRLFKLVLNHAADVIEHPQQGMYGDPNKGSTEERIAREYAQIFGGPDIQKSLTAYFRMAANNSVVSILSLNKFESNWVSYLSFRPQGRDDTYKTKLIITKDQGGWTGYMPDLLEYESEFGPLSRSTLK